MVNLINIIIEPGKTFQHIKEKDDWWIPFAGVVIVTLLFLWVSSPALTRIMTQKMVEYIKYVMAPIATLIGFLFISLILWFLGNISGADWDYIKALDLYAYSSVVQIIRSLLTTVLLLVKGIPNIATARDMELATGLNLIFRPENPKLYALASGIEVFSIWQFALIAYGISEIAGVSKKKAAIASIVVYILFLGFSALFARGV